MKNVENRKTVRMRALTGTKLIDALPLPRGWSLVPPHDDASVPNHDKWVFVAPDGHSRAVPTSEHILDIVDLVRMALGEDRIEMGDLKPGPIFSWEGPPSPQSLWRVNWR